MKPCIPGVFIASALLINLDTEFSTLHAQGTAFTYQGRLNSGSNPANGNYDLTFSLFSASSGGSAVAGPLTNSATTVSNGLFLATVDFGGVFTGTNYWLEIGVRTNGNGAFTTLTPRQPVTPTPYAIFAEGSSNLVGVVPGGGLSGSYGSVVTMNNSANQFNGSFTGNGGGLTNLNVATFGGLTTSNFWQLGGNNVAPGKFLGSTNNQPVEFRVNNLRVGQLSYASNAASGYSPNVVFGNGGNFVSNTVVGATIIGGGVANGFYVPSTNAVSADFGTVVGGYGNTANGKYSVAMGFRSLASGTQATALGGASATGDYSIAAGNSGANGKFSTAMGNSTSSARGATAMGESTAANQDSTAMGGSTATGFGATALGSLATASGDYSTALGESTATNLNTTAAGASFAYGQSSTAMGESFAFGQNCTAMGNSSADGNGATALGYSSLASGAGTTVGGGQFNTNFAGCATVAGGNGNFVPVAAAFSTISGGAKNIVRYGIAATIAGGGQNYAGYDVVSTGDYSTVGGGYGNTAQGNYSTTPGGNLNWAPGAYSFAAGNRAKANYNGDFAWADSQNADFNSTGTDQFSIRAQGGVQLDNSTSMYFGNQTRQMLNLYQAGYGIGVQNYTEYFRSGSAFAWFAGGVHSDTANDPGAGGVQTMNLDHFGNLVLIGSVYAVDYNQISDRNLKENFKPVSVREVLNKVAALPISRWNYKKDASSEHLGPMAQDFYAAFNVGPDDKHITTVDESGVALAAIQGLNEKVENGKQKAEMRIQILEAENGELKQQNDSLAARLNELEAVVRRLAAQK